MKIQNNDSKTRMPNTNQNMDNPFVLEEDSNKLFQNQRIQQNMHSGVTQAVGIENEIARIIERKI